MFDPACLLVPERARALPVGAKEREFAALCLRLVWHAVFDTCPGLLAATTPDGARVLEPFLAWAQDRRLAMDWTLHAHLLAWLIANPAVGVTLTREHVVELLAATASRWALGDQGPDTGILLTTRLLPGEGMLAWKPPSLEEGRKVLLVRLDGVEVPLVDLGWVTLADEAALTQVEGAAPWAHLPA